MLCTHVITHIYLLIQAHLQNKTDENATKRLHTHTLCSARSLPFSHLFTAAPVTAELKLSLRIRFCSQIWGFRPPVWKAAVMFDECVLYGFTRHLIYKSHCESCCTCNMCLSSNSENIRYFGLWGSLRVYNFLWCQFFSFWFFSPQSALRSSKERGNKLQQQWQTEQWFLLKWVMFSMEKMWFKD